LNDVDALALVFIPFGGAVPYDLFAASVLLMFAIFHPWSLMLTGCANW
jgi:hypothetical protein